MPTALSRLITTCLAAAGTLLIALSVQAQGLEPDERAKFREQLREAHRQRLQGHYPHRAGSVVNHSEHANHKPLPSERRVGAQVEWSPEERHQLRRELRDRQAGPGDGTRVRVQEGGGRLHRHPTSGVAVEPHRRDRMHPSGHADPSLPRRDEPRVGQ